MIKERYVDPLQEAMEVKMYDEEWKGHDIAPISRYSVGLESALGYAAEIERSYNSIMEQAGIAQMKYYVENGELLKLTETEGEETSLNANNPGTALATKKKGFFANLAEKAIKLLESIRNKIRAAFNWVKQKILDTAIANKAFIAKYGKDIEAFTGKVNVSGAWTFSGFGKDKNLPNFTVQGLGTVSPKDADEVAGARAGWRRANYGDLSNEAYTGDTAAYAKAIKAKIYGEKKDQELSPKEEFGYIKEGKNAINMVHKTFITSDNTIKELIKHCKKIGKGYENGDKMITLYKDVANDMQATCNIVSKCIVDRVRQAKAVCIKALSSKKAAIKDAEKTSAAQEKKDAEYGNKASKNEAADLRSISVEDILAASF